MLGHHDQVQKQLTLLNPIEEDDEGWNLALRTLFIMNDFELEKTENVVKRVENMRKHISKLKKVHKQKDREVLKSEVLQKLVNTKFDFVLTRGRCQDELDKLRSPDEKYQWNIMSPEFVIFDQWFESRVFKQKLTLKIPEYVPPILNTGSNKIQEKINDQ